MHQKIKNFGSVLIIRSKFNLHNFTSGLIAGLIPFWIPGSKINDIFFQHLQFYHYSGAIVFVIGLVILVSCIINFAIKGRGTLSPFDPTKRLVITGLYRYTRNPMYVGVMMILIGEVTLFQSF